MANLSTAILVILILLGVVHLDKEYYSYSPRVIKVHINIEDPVIYEATVYTLNEWDKVSNIDFKIVSKRGHLTISRKDLDEDKLGLFRGYPRRKGQILLDIDRHYGERLAIHTMYHEIGHFLGLGHYDDETSIMYKYGGIDYAMKYGKKLSKKDIERLKVKEIGG